MPSVVIYTRSTCAPCKTVKYFLNKKGVKFIEKDVDEVENAAVFQRLADFPMLPLILVGKEKIQGANLPLLNKLLTV